MAEEVGSHEEVDQAEGGHGPELVEQQMEGRALQEDTAQDDQEVAQRVKAGEVLHPKRHVGDRGGEAGQQDGGHEEQE